MIVISNGAFPSMLFFLNFPFTDFLAFSYVAAVENCCCCYWIAVAASPAVGPACCGWC